MILAALFIFAAIASFGLPSPDRERCGRDWEHPAHSWREQDGETLRCDGGSDLVDAQEECARADELFEAGYFG